MTSSDGILKVSAHTSIAINTKSARSRDLNSADSLPDFESGNLLVEETGNALIIQKSVQKGRKLDMIVSSLSCETISHVLMFVRKHALQ